MNETHKPTYFVKVYSKVDLKSQKRISEKLSDMCAGILDGCHPSSIPAHISLQTLEKIN